MTFIKANFCSVKPELKITSALENAATNLTALNLSGLALTGESVKALAFGTFCTAV